MTSKHKRMGNHKSHRKRNRRKNAVRALVLLFFALFTMVFLLYTDYFDIKEVNIIGNNYVHEKEILRNEDFNIGSNIFKFNKNKAQEQIERHSLIKTATITRKYPHRVNIEIVEREVSGIISFEDGSFIYIDQEGTVLKKGDSLNTYLSPLITGLGGISFIVGQPIDLEPDWLKSSLLDIISTLQDHQLIEKISEINVLEDNTIQLYTQDGSVIRIGDAKTMKKKMEFLKVFLTETHPKRVIDIRHGGDPVSRPRTN